MQKFNINSKKTPHLKKEGCVNDDGYMVIILLGLDRTRSPPERYLLPLRSAYYLSPLNTISYVENFD